MDAYKTYHHIKKQHQEAEQLAEKVVADFVEKYKYSYYICFPEGYPPFMKLFSLIQNGFGDLLWPVLEKLNYSFEPEVQFMLANIDSLLRNNCSVCYSSVWKMFYSFENICKIQNHYVLDTKIGTLVTTPLLEYSENTRVQAYAFLQSSYGFCHDSVEQFLRFNPEYQAVTGLIPDQFGTQQYHSYVRHDGKIIDIAHGACIEEEEYNRVMKPTPLNSIYGYQLDEEMAKLDGNEIGAEKSLLLRLAVAKQRKM